MRTQLYIPRKLKIGFQNRSDCYDKKLAYVIYYDQKGKLRKEASWQSWRDKKIEPIEFDNVPTSGFVLNKKVGGYKSDWNFRKTYCRIWDARGFEFEITVPNLLYILEHCTSVKGKGLEGDFIYAWDNTDLVLLPAGAPEYQAASTFTNLQSCKIGAKDLVPGCSYKTKKEEDLIYVGRFNWYQFNNWYYNDRTTDRQGKKFYIFTSGQKDKKDGYSFQLKSSLDFLAQKNSDEIVSSYADIIEGFQKNPHSSRIVEWEVVPVEFSTETFCGKYDYSPRLNKTRYYILIDDFIYEYDVSAEFERNYGDNSKEIKYNLRGYTAKENYALQISNQTVKKTEYSRTSYSYYNSYKRTDIMSEEKIRQYQWGDLYVTLENGKRIKVDSFHNL